MLEEFEEFICIFVEIMPMFMTQFVADTSITVIFRGTLVILFDERAYRLYVVTLLSIIGGVVSINKFFCTVMFCELSISIVTLLD